MLAAIDRIQGVLALQKNGFDISLAKSHAVQDILSSCNEIRTTELSAKLYEGNNVIQRELLENTKFTRYLRHFASAEIKSTRIAALISAIKTRGDEVINFPKDMLLKALSNTELGEDAFYDYLKYFSDIAYTDEQRDTIAKNLNAFVCQDEIKAGELTDPQRALLKLPFLHDSDLIPLDGIGEALEMLVANQKLVDLIQFLYINRIEAQLELEHYKAINQQTTEIKEPIQKLHTLLDSESSSTTRLMNMWLQNGCRLKDLEIMGSKFSELSLEERHGVSERNSSYINFIYGKKFKRLSFDDVSRYQEDLLIYAIANSKKAFIRLVDENAELFTKINYRSILFDTDFYKKYVNINALSLKDLQKCSELTEKWNIAALKERLYTFGEIQALFGTKEQYVVLFNHLEVLPVDQRIAVIRQLTKKDLLQGITDKHALLSLAGRLVEKPLYRWIETDFAHINGMNAVAAVDLLIAYDHIKKLIHEVTTTTEAAYIARNKESAARYTCLDEMKKEIHLFDTAWKELSEILELSEDFINSNADHIYQFLIQDGAQIALTYIKTRSITGHKAFSRVVKAELMGKFYTLKYFGNDLEKEIDFPITQEQQKIWEHNSCVNENDITVCERDDFYSTMQLGEIPIRTCLSYVNGAHNECLLSNFDTNKKLLLATLNGKVVARAIVRLTKGKYSLENTKHSLSFADVENIKDEPDKNGVNANEYITLFLEKFYSAHIPPAVIKQIQEMFISILEKKTIAMGATLVLSKAYSPEKNYIRTNYHVYISKSKSGHQYLDSLNGSASVSDEGSYRSGVFLVCRL